MKKIIKKGMNYFDLFNLYGFDAMWKRVENIKFHKRASLSVVKNVHIVSQAELERQRKVKFSSNIKISVITPLFNTPEQYLIELIESLKSQTYSDWELCLADGSDEKHSYVGDICRKYQKEDNRIIYKTLEKNEGISENTNECIKLATGEYYGLLDHDDLLHPSALFEIMLAIEKYKAEFIYTDEAKFSENPEEIVSPVAFNFKPGFGKYDLRSHNYICHFTVFNKKLLDGEDRLYRAEYDGSQDHDMVLRLTEKTKNIVHIPKVLYYWRLHSNSVSMDLSSKSYAVDAAIHAVEAQLDRLGEEGEVRSNLPFQTIYKVSYKIGGEPLVSIVLHNANDISAIENNVREIIERTDYRPIEFLYSGQEEINIDSSPGICITNVEVGNRSSRGKMWNSLIGRAKGDYIVLMDAKSIPAKADWLEEMLMLVQKKDVFVVGPKIYYSDQTIAYAGGALWKTEKDKIKIIGAHDLLPDMGYEALLQHVRNTTFALAACMSFSKKDWEEQHGFSEEDSGYEDIEFCLKGLDKGKNNVWTCFALIHFRGKETIFSSVSEVYAEKFLKKNEKYFEQESYYHNSWETMGLV